MVGFSSYSPHRLSAVFIDGQISFCQCSLAEIILKELVQDSRRAMGVRGRKFTSFSAMGLSCTSQFLWSGDSTEELT
ncbi:hypothetical protein D0962_25945 [Leptolyngbyaceae cyanobacterium CCMR0082]|uniref:Uncharacterized protein n=1 Tax=Adonisia turfae CCMR0082 TaxID=2304604 RepID=A0A6M0SCG6_9CYAN|nr:hypothetical protein [Adonisia turfae CCMR0082]